MKRRLENISYKNRTVKKNFDTIIISGKKLFNFSSNDYLSLSKNKKIINESKDGWKLMDQTYLLQDLSQEI